MRNEDNKVSIIVTVYNAERYLLNCVNSLLRQTFQNLEIILIDDGSRDNSSILCDEWIEKDARIAVYHQENAGVSAARNRGISMASGKYVVFVDSDDWLEKNFVEELVKNSYAGNLPLTGYVVDYRAESKKHHVEKRYPGERICCPKKEKVVSLFQAGLFSPVWNKLYERSRLLENNITFRKDMNLGEDILFNLEYFKTLSGDFRVINEPLYHYMHWGNISLTSCYNENYMEYQKIIYKEFLDCISRCSVDSAANTQLCCLYFDALVTGIDNLYMNRKEMEPSFYHFQMSERRVEPELRTILGKIKGKEKVIYEIRYFFVRNGFYMLDFYLRRMVKRILGLG